MRPTQIGDLKPGDVILLPVVVRDLDHHMPDLDDMSVTLTFRPADYSGTDSKLDVYDANTVIKVDDTDPEDCMQFFNAIEARNAFLADDAERAADPDGYEQRLAERRARFEASVSRD